MRRARRGAATRRRPPAVPAGAGTLVGAAGLAAALTLVLVTGLQHLAPPEVGRLEPLGTRSRSGPAPVVPAGAPITAITTTTTTTAATPTTDAAPGRPSGPVELEGLLADYDATLAALSSDPAAALDTGHPLRGRWHQLVAEGSELDQSMLERVRDDVAERSMVVRPGPDGVVFRTRALGSRAVGDDAIEFEHCGYSAGIGVRIGTGEILDDRRASTRGWGRAERDPSGVLRLVALRDDQVRLLDPGEADPCPALGADGRGEDGS